MEWTINELENIITLPQRAVSSAACNASALASATAGLNLRETQSFTDALEELRADTTSNRKQQLRRPIRSDNSPMVLNSPIRCTGLECFNSNGCFRTREQDTMRLFITGPEILNFQGRCYSADDIAPIWKKDCRMWLWKAVRNARKRRRQLTLIH